MISYEQKPYYKLVTIRYPLNDEDKGESVWVCPSIYVKDHKKMLEKIEKLRK